MRHALDPPSKKNFHVALDSLLRTLYILLMTTTALVMLGVTVDLSRVETDGRAWYGKISFTRDEATAEATWVGVDGSDMGEIHDIEGEDEALCELVESMACGEIFAALGDPCDEDGRRERAAAMAIESEIDERLMYGRVA